MWFTISTVQRVKKKFLLESIKMIQSRVVEDNSINEFPYLVKSKTTGAIILLTSPKNGTVVAASGGLYELGYVSDDWEMSCFQFFRGEVILKGS